MSVDYRAVLLVGCEFEDVSEAAAFLESHRKIPVKACPEDDATRVENWLAKNKSLYRGFEDYYTGYGYIIGIHIRTYPTDEFLSNYDKAMEEWGSMFPHVKAELIKTFVVS